MDVSVTPDTVGGTVEIPGAAASGNAVIHLTGAWAAVIGKSGFWGPTIRKTGWFEPDISERGWARGVPG